MVERADAFMRFDASRDEAKAGEAVLQEMQSPSRRTAKDLVPHMVDEAVSSLCGTARPVKKIGKRVPGS